MENSIILCVVEKNGANILPGCMNGYNGRGFLADLWKIIIVYGQAVAIA